MSPHRAVFTALVQSKGWTRGAELGVDKGILFGQLLESCPSLSLLGVDVCPVPARRTRCEGLAAQYADRAQLLVMTTHDAADRVEDRSLDFVFIDADHSDAAVSDDIARWQSKVRPGGWLGGHDYHRTKFPGVVAAVDRAFGRAVKALPATIWGVQC